MSEEFKASGPLPIRVAVRGAWAAEKVHVIRGGQISSSQSPGAQDVELEYSDVEACASADTRYYYVRVEQVNKQVAWSIPFWVN